MSLATSGLRWLAVPIVGAALIALCVLLATQLVSMADQRCTSMVADSCVESWHTDAVEWAVYLGVILAVLVITLSSAWIAPAYKRTTALLMGALVSAPLLAGYFMTNWPDLLLPSLLAIGSALLGIFIVWKRHGPKPALETQAA